MSETSFKVGDIVVASRRIERHDHCSFLDVGEKAKITSIFQLDKNSPQIVMVSIKDRLPMCDIVCYKDCPFVKEPQEKETKDT